MADENTETPRRDPSIVQLVEQDSEGQCGSECKTIERACQEQSQLTKLLDEDPAIMEMRTSLAKGFELYKSAQVEINDVSW